jgi:hypothetical protein
MRIKIRLFPAALIVAVLAGVTAAQSPIHARTDDGKGVILSSDGTWKYAPVDPDKQPATDVYVESITMARADQDQPGEPTSRFAVADHTIFCIVRLNTARVDTKVKFVWKAVEVEGADSGEFMTVDYVTKPIENRVDGHVKLPRDWPKGKYRVEVSINGGSARTADYTIE